jgi:hypothetical protein
MQKKVIFFLAYYPQKQVHPPQSLPLVQAPAAPVRHSFRQMQIYFTEKLEKTSEII